MAYDGRLMRRALARYDEDKQRRAESFRARERTVYTKCPRIADTVSYTHLTLPTIA